MRQFNSLTGMMVPPHGVRCLR